MCLAIPSKVVSINHGMATIDVYGARKDVSIILLPETPRLGDYVLVHAGFAIQSIKAETFQTGEIMHESSIAHSILEIVDEQCREQACASVTAITVRLGKATGVMPEALQSAFNTLKENTVARNAVLTFEVVPVGGSCHACNRDFDVPDIPDAHLVSACPLCGSVSFEISRGRELEIMDMELN